MKKVFLTGMTPDQKKEITDLCKSQNLSVVEVPGDMNTALAALDEQIEKNSIVVIGHSERFVDQKGKYNRLKKLAEKASEGQVVYALSEKGVDEFKDERNKPNNLKITHKNEEFVDYIKVKILKMEMSDVPV